MSALRCALILFSFSLASLLQSLYAVLSIETGSISGLRANLTFPPMDVEQNHLQHALGALKLPELKALAAGLQVTCEGAARRKATFIDPLTTYMLANKVTLVQNPTYQPYFVGGAGALPKARTTSNDKAEEDAAAAAGGQGKETPAYKGIMARKLTSDPPGRLPSTIQKKVAFLGGGDASGNGDKGTPPVTPKRASKPAPPSNNLSDTELEISVTPKRGAPQVQQASTHVKVLIHNLGPGLEEVIVPLSEGVCREEATDSADESTYYIKLDDVVTSMTTNDVASPLKGRTGRLKAFMPADESAQPVKLRDIGTVDKVLAGDVARLKALAAMNQHAVVKRPGPNGTSEFELNIVFMPGENVQLGHAPATGGAEPAGSTGPSGNATPAPPHTQPSTVPLKKTQLDNNAEFHTALSAYLTSKGVAPWTGPLAEVMKQRLERFLHVTKAMSIVSGWRTSLRNSSYDIPKDFHDADDALPDYWRWTGGHFTISAIRTALGLKHTTASEDLGCFNIPEKLPEDVKARLQPLIDWIENPDDEQLQAKFGSLSVGDFKDWRTNALEGKAQKKSKERSKDKKNKEKKRRQDKKGKESRKDKKRRERDDDDDSSHERKRRKRKTSASLDDSSESE
ncbi:hypothetical protein AURDEDRAFT_126949 [Auricularia subglabra TFB-10046 SS5]|nr:hypothetical protein AURDEDRAFT_126949 [Auricularia subglabra TFB-10046 SS5]